jgi:hypothetical protein
LRCRVCGRHYDLKEYADNIDDDFEERMANIPLNRL